MSGETFTSIFSGKQNRLVELLDMEHGLLVTLEAFGVITYRHRTAIKVTFVTVGIFCIIWSDMLSQKTGPL